MWVTNTHAGRLSSTAEVPQITKGIAAAQRTGIVGHYLQRAAATNCLLNHLVGAGEQHRRNVDAERFRRV